MQTLSDGHVGPNTQLTLSHRYAYSQDVKQAISLQSLWSFLVVYSSKRRCKSITNTFFFFMRVCVCVSSCVQRLTESREGAHCQLLVNYWNRSVSRRRTASGCVLSVCLSVCVSTALHCRFTAWAFYSIRDCAEGINCCAYYYFLSL